MVNMENPSIKIHIMIYIYIYMHTHLNYINPYKQKYKVNNIYIYNQLLTVAMAYYPQLPSTWQHCLPAL